MNLNDTLTHSYAINPNTFQQVYFIQNKDVHLGQQVYTVAQPVVAELKSVSSSVKSFYENSLNFVAQTPNVAAQVLQRDNININVPQQYANVQKYIINPSPSINVTQHSKPNIIKLQRVIKAPAVPDIHNTIKKVVPFEIAVPPLKKKIQRNGKSANHTSVPLLRFGKQYHSVNKLTEEQKRLVSQALKNVPENGPMEPIYDAASNTTITFKIVSPNDLKVLDNKKVVISTSTPTTVENNKKRIQIRPKPKEVVEEEHPPPAAETETVVKVTRSGRTVRAPKHVDIENDSEESPQKHKKKHVTPSMKCFQCSNEFSSIIKLRRHYEAYPSHIPTANHTSLFQCLISIVNGSKPNNRTDTFLQQLELLIAKLRSILPCLMMKVGDVNGTFCRISEDVGRLLDIESGKYNIDINGLSCNKDENDTCEHNRPKPQETTASTDIKPSQMWLTKHIEETAADQDSGICARTNSIENWSPHVKRKWQYNPNKNENKNNKKRNVAIYQDKEIEHVNMAVDDNDANLTSIIPESNTTPQESQQPQFQSAHFDVSYSPMKNQQSGVFKEFQLNMNNLPTKFNGQFLQSSTFMEAMDQTAAVKTLEGLLQELNSNAEGNDNDLDMISTLKTDDNVRRDVFERPKDWIIGPADQSQDTYQPNVCIEPTKIHITNTPALSQHLNNNSMEAALNVSDSCLSLPHDITSPCLSFHDSDLRNNSIDIGLDLFSFNNS